MVDERPTSRAIARTVFIVVLCVAAVYLVYLLRTPIAYVLIWALFAIAALVGGSLLGVVGTLLAIPGAATIQIALREYLDYKGMLPRPAGTDEAIPAA